MENKIFSDLFGRKGDKQICSSTLQSAEEDFREITHPIKNCPFANDYRNVASSCPANRRRTSRCLTWTH